MCDCLAEHRENGVDTELSLMKVQQTRFYSFEMNGYEIDEDNFTSEKDLDRGNYKFDLENELNEELALCEGRAETEEDDIYAQLVQKEKDLLLAAELGKALLEKNEELSKNNEALQEELAQRTEELEQERHELRLKFERLEGFHESRVHELQADLQSLRNELNSVKSASVSDLQHKRATFADIREENERLHTELQQIKNIKDDLAQELSTAKKKLNKTRSFDHGIHAALAEVDELHEKIQRLSEERDYFEHTSKELASSKDALKKENAELLERNRAIEKKLAESKTTCANFEEELDESKLVNAHLQSQVDEIKMQASLGTSLFSELSMLGDDDSGDNDDDVDDSTTGQSFVPVGQSLRPVQSLNGTPNPVATSSSFNMVLPTPHTNKRQRKASSFIYESDDSDIEYDETGDSIAGVTRDPEVYARLEAEELVNARLKKEIFEAHSELSTLYEDLRSSSESLQSLDELNIGTLEQQGDFKPGCLTTFVHSFKDVIKELANSENEKLKSVEELKRELHDLNNDLQKVSQDVLLANTNIREKDMEINQLQYKIDEQSSEIQTLREERRKLAAAECKDDLAMDIIYAESEREREAALKRENDIAQELERTKEDAGRLDEQLLEAIQQKIELSEQLEQWQYDMASLIDEQVQKQMKTIAKEQEAIRNRKRLPFSKGWNWSSSHRRQNVQH